jgi:hypothetical protein
MTDTNYTHLQFVVDRSGSMHSIASDMEGAVRQLLDEQKALPGRLTVGFVRFDDVVEETAVFAAPDDVDPTLSPRGRTALHDAVGMTVTRLGERLAALPEDQRPGKVILAIVTDGKENASREYTADTVRPLIETQTNDYAWDVAYLGANQDAVLVAQGMGIREGSALTYDPGQVAVAAASLGDYTARSRSGRSAAFTDADRQAAQGS